MQPIIDYAKNDFLSFIGTLSITGVFLTFIIKATINHQFLKNIEKHRSKLMKINDKYRQELNSEIERLKHQQQRVFKDFELYTSKKHERYPEVYKYLEIAYGRIFSLRGEGRYLSFENTNRTDIETYLKSLNVTNQDTEQILNLWDKQKSIAINKLQSIRRLINYNEAYEKWIEANDFFIFNELFLSDEAAKHVRIVLDYLWEYLELLEPSFPLEPEMTRRQTELKNQILPTEREKMKVLIKQELTMAFSNTNS